MGMHQVGLRIVLCAGTTLGCAMATGASYRPAAGDAGDCAPSAAALEGRSFKGYVRAAGVMGLFRVRGVVAFRDGMLSWTSHGDSDSGSYSTRVEGDMLRFDARLPADGGTWVEWTGRFDGERLHEVRATWMRQDEEDFIHDLLLPDVVTLHFQPFDDSDRTANRGR